MYPTPPLANNRILIIDDNPAIHEDFAKVLMARPDQGDLQLADAEAALFGEAGAGSPVQPLQFTLESAYQGEEGLRMVERATAEGRPYAIAFVDVRMPPGWDGVETIARLWEVDGQLQVVLCTAYSDYSWQEISQHLGRPENLLILKKPFDNIEVVQLAHALTNKWLLTSQANAWVDHLDHKVMERTQELRSANARLEQAAQEAQRLAEVAQAANRAKTDFLTVVSHEMLTPMNGIVGLAEYLQTTSLTTDQQDCANDILSSGERMTRIIRQVLDYIEADAPSGLSTAAAPVDLRAAVTETVQGLAERAAAKGLTLAVRIRDERPARVRGNGARIRQALACLIENAIRFSARGTVSIEVAPALEGEAAPGFLRCAVRDQGVGIPAAKQDLIFRPFAQVDGSLSRENDGLGLSLALTRKWIESMGGQIGFDSEPGRGSTFWVTLPEATAAGWAA
jgi:signal transduction histidine kinase